MTDNLDPNDLSWLDDPNGEDSDDFNSEFGTEQLLPDWELLTPDLGQPLDRSNPESDDDLAGLFDDPPEIASNEPAMITQEIPSWLQASAPATSTQDIGMIEDLVPLGQPATGDGQGIPSWLDTQEMAAAPIANKEDVPPWLAEADESAQLAFNVADAAAEAMPEVAAGDQASTLPPWLQDADDLGAAEANAFESSFDDLDFDVDQQAASGGLSDPFGGVSAQPTSAVFGDDMPDWMRTREQSTVPQDDLASLLNMSSIPGETTDPLLSNLLQSGGGSGGVDLDLLSLLEQTDGSTVRTGMLSPIEDRDTPPSFGGTDDSDFSDFDTFLAQPDPTPEFHPMLDEPSPDSDILFDFSSLAKDDVAPFGEMTQDSDSLDFAAYDSSDLVDLSPVEAAPPAPMPPAPFQRPVAASKPPVKDDDFDSFLTSLQDDEFGANSLPSDSGSMDLSALLRDPGFSDLPSTPQAAPQNEPAMPEFLRDVSVRQSSIAALLRQQQDVPLEDLPEELRALHEELAAVQQSPLPSEVGLPALPIAPLTPSQPRTLPGLSDSQRRGAELLRSLAGVSGVVADEADAAVEATQKRTQRRRFGINIIRLLVAASLTVAVVLPFISDAEVFKVGIQPPAVFAPSSLGGEAYDFIDALPAGALVLVSVDYSPGSIAELDALAAPILRHVFVRGLKPVIIGSDPVSLQHVGRLTDELGQGRQRNIDYVIGRYVLGEAVGTQDFVQNIGTLLARDINGLPTQLEAGDFNAFANVILLTDRADTVRMWAEQVAPRVRAPLTFAVGAGAAPLSAPYAFGGRLLVGLRDGMTYARQLDAQYPPGSFVLPTETPSPLPPTATPTLAVTAEPTVEGTVDPLQPTSEPTLENQVTTEPTLEGGATAEPTLEGQATVEPTVTDSMTATPTSTSEPTLEPTADTEGGSAQATPGPTLSSSIFAVITGTDRVNIRQGAGTNFQVVTSVAPGDRFRVVSGSSDGQWLQIELTDGRVGWVSALRAQIVQGESRLPGMRVGAGGLYQAQNLAINTSAERRWYAVSLGAVVAALLMGIGSFMGVIQIIMRRRR